MTRILDHEERLRHALRAAADSVEPAADGLERIRARLTRPRPAVAAWMVAAAEPALLWLRPVLARLRRRVSPAGAQVSAGTGTGVTPVRPGGPLRWTRSAWLRPVAAMGAFAVIIGSGAIALGELPGAITQVTAIGGRQAQSGQAAHGAGSSTLSSKERQIASQTQFPGPFWPEPSRGSQASSGHSRPQVLPIKVTPSPSPSCTPTPTPTPTPTITPTITPTPTPTPTPTITPTITPSPSPSDSTSPADDASETPSAGTVLTGGAAASGAADSGAADSGAAQLSSSSAEFSSGC
jgi:hypothetical protein